VHQVVALHRRGHRARQVDGAGVVDEDVDAAELRGCGLDRGLDLIFGSHIDHAGKRVPAGLLDLLGGRVNGPRKLGMRLRRLGGHDDVGAVARGT
jgi:hypothetical protein